VYRAPVPSEPTAIAIAPHGATPALAALIDRLRAHGIKVTVTDEVGAAAQLAVQAPDAPPCILLDLDGANDEIEDRRRAAEAIRRAAVAIPHTQPIAITGRADAALIVACVRAGAGDVLDIQLEGTANAPALLQRVWQRQLEHAHLAAYADDLRAMIEELLKDVIKTERRALALEEMIQPGRDPAVLIVERERDVADTLADRLEEAGITSYAYVTGEDAVRQAAKLGVDLAVVAAALPTIDGLETIRLLRQQAPGLPAFLLAAGTPPDQTAELGIVGVVQKPLADLAAVVSQLSQLARDGMARNREQTYLERIKERHEHVLARYRSLPRD
jgi:CheY-like chemotaxis protein